MLIHIAAASVLHRTIRDSNIYIRAHDIRRITAIPEPESFESIHSSPEPASGEAEKLQNPHLARRHQQLADTPQLQQQQSLHRQRTCRVSERNQEASYCDCLLSTEV